MMTICYILRTGHIITIQHNWNYVLICNPFQNLVSGKFLCNFLSNTEIVTHKSLLFTQVITVCNRCCALKHYTEVIMKIVILHFFKSLVCTSRTLQSVVHKVWDLHNSANFIRTQNAYNTNLFNVSTFLAPK